MLKRNEIKAWHALSTSPFMADEALFKLLSEYDFKTVLDVGCGEGLHARVFVEHGKDVLGVDYGESIYFKRNSCKFKIIKADFNTFKFGRLFDCVWCSHVLEHQLNTQTFLEKVFSVLKEGGVLAITIPPLKSTIVGGHVSLWNAGLLLYRLVLAGFDCREAVVRRYDYNISVIVRKCSIIDNIPLTYDAGDIQLIRKYLPQKIQFEEKVHDASFNGDIVALNWDVASRKRYKTTSNNDTVAAQHKEVSAKLAARSKQLDDFKALAEKRSLQLVACYKTIREFKEKMAQQGERIQQFKEESAQHKEVSAKLAARSKQLDDFKALAEKRRVQLAACYKTIGEFKEKLAQQGERIQQLTTKLSIQHK